jgi:dihydrofolate synthase/folylpolyglutamate synthase
MTDPSSLILERFPRDLGLGLTLRPAYFDLLRQLGDPHRNLPPVFHVAGTNGKGSTCAFLRAILESAGYKTHVYTSPHLVRFHERIRIAGKLIAEPELESLLTECEAKAEPGGVSRFEAITAAAFAAFARHNADFTILETGLGGRLDATNIVEKPLATLIARLSFDHRDYLGDTLDKIAREKAGIMRPHIPCFAAAQPDPMALAALRDEAAKRETPLLLGGEAWHVAPTLNGFSFKDAARGLDLPAPALLGRHQIDNAGLAIAALGVLPQPLSADSIAAGLRRVEWPARLQRLTGSLAKTLPSTCELWLDGGHNDSAGEILALQAKQWRAEDGKPLSLVMGMLNTKNPAEFLAPLAPWVQAFRAVPIPHETTSLSAAALAVTAGTYGIRNVQSADSVASALADLTRLAPQGRILICGSLYLAGEVLKWDAA